MATDQAHFKLTYDGEATRDHTIEVEKYAPSLLALARSAKAVQAAIAPGSPPSKIEIKATTGGSFIVDLVIQAPSIVEATVDALLSRPITATLAASQLLQDLAAAITFLIWIKGKKNLRQSRAEGGKTIITAGDGSQVVIADTVLLVVQDSQFRVATEALVAPLDSDGIDSISLSSEQLSEKVVIRTEDRDAFQIPEQIVEKYDPVVREAALTIESVNFVEGNKWRFSDGGSAFYATIEDLGFISRVENGEEAFASRDTLRVTLRTQQTMTSKGALKIDNAIIKVHGHIPGPRQIQLPFVDE
ncbi:hypothetical protein FHU41_002561 [Psychromicrobium silvestre]|uniref:DUF7946 domain-containing protein n=1 Tax=Psychromicrobium silvestre TaxID=1645614 RepID=A0A7Y9LVG3_9MICC|nr:hypothetical protein [Psychromicrobium silvestre]NYE96311.1 hypothetical protein [Psychromicrobium silvestre]